MLIEESKRRQSELEKYINEMAASSMDDAEIRKMAGKLKILYSGGFRHNYSDFFPLILDISRDDNELSLDYLSNNLENARALVEKDYVEGEKEFKGLYRWLFKLSDHINLEIARYSYYSTKEQKIKDLEVKNIMLHENLKVSTEELKTSTEELNAAKQQAKDMQTQYTTILGIFAAVILAFVGSFTFSTSVLDHISEANIYQLIIIALIIGWVFYNMVFALLEFLREINGLKKSKESSLEEKETSHYWAFNVVIIIMILITAIAWHCTEKSKLETAATPTGVEIFSDNESEPLQEEVEYDNSEASE